MDLTDALLEAADDMDPEEMIAALRRQAAELPDLDPEAWALLLELERTMDQGRHE